MSVDLKEIFSQFKVAATKLHLIPLAAFPISSREQAEHTNFFKFLGFNNNYPNPVGRKYQHADRWFFANGIVTDRTAWGVQASMISDIFEKKIEALFNPTMNFAVDIIETIYGRTFNRMDESTSFYVDVLEPVLKSGQEVHVVAYSQGAVVVANAVRTLLKRKVDCSKLNVYTFGSPENDFNLDGKIYSEHFANKDDYVARIGVVHYGAGDAPVYIADKTGHFLNAHYLYDFMKGAYCGGKSKLYSYVKNKDLG